MKHGTLADPGYHLPTEAHAEPHTLEKDVPRAHVRRRARDETVGVGLARRRPHGELQDDRGTTFALPMPSMLVIIQIAINPIHVVIIAGYYRGILSAQTMCRSQQCDTGGKAVAKQMELLGGCGVGHFNGQVSFPSMDILH